jgi:glucose-6-phosphate isomerase
MGVACARSALFENPAYTLGLAAVFAETDLGAGTPVMLGSSARLGPLLHWQGRMWGAVLSDVVNVGGVVRHRGTAGVTGTVGDEELLQALLRGPRDKLVIVWEVIEGGPFGEHAAVQVRALQDLLERERIPHLKVRLPGLDARTVGASVLLAEHAAVAAGCYADTDPLGLAGVDAWYTAVQRARAVDGGAPSA